MNKLIAAVVVVGTWLVILLAGRSPPPPEPSPPASIGHPAPHGIWELADPRFPKYSADPKSKLVQRILQLPITEDLGDAETARVALFMLHLDRDAELLEQFMVNDVIAELLGLARRPAGTVAQAIAVQGAPGAPDLRGRLEEAFQAAARNGDRSVDGRRILLRSRKLLIAGNDVLFGYPANADDSPRNRAHVLIGSSSCWDKGTCQYEDLVGYVRTHTFVSRTAEQAGLAAVGGLLAAGLYILLSRRPMSVPVVRAARLAVLPAAAVLIIIGGMTFSVKTTPGEGAAAGVGIVPIVQGLVAMAFVAAAFWLLWLAATARRQDSS